MLKSIGRGLKFTGKWALIAAGAYAFGAWLNSLEPENRLWIVIFGMGMAISYVDGSLKDRIRTLEWSVQDLQRRLSQYE